MKIEHKAAFLSLYAQLSPENLTCDGELSHRQVSSRRAKIMAEMNKLGREAGRTPSEEEAYSWYPEVQEYDRQQEKVRRSNHPFWSQQADGTILHYHNGFGEYVRGVVVTREGVKKIKPIAMVGNWRQHDMPRRQENGEIHYPHHASKVVNGGMDAEWQPSESCVFEAPSFCPPMGRDQQGDPRTMQPVDLTLPALTPSEEELARLERSIDGIRQITSDHYSLRPRDPKATLERIRTAVNNALKGA